MRFFAVFGALVLGVIPASAGVVTFTSSAAFQAAGSISNSEDFESFEQGFLGNPFTTHGILFTQLPGGHPNMVPYVSDPGNLGNPIEPTSKTLDANGDENFQIQLASGATFTAFGFDIYTNQFSAPVVSLYDASNDLIGSYTLEQGPNTLGFFGATSTTPISSVTFIVDRGWIQNTALDNVQLGQSAETPEPSVFGMATLGLVGLLAYRRRQTR